MFWCFSYWSPNRITSKLLSFILTVWGNHGQRESLRRVHLFVFTGDQAMVSARVYVPVWLCVCATACKTATLFFPPSNSFDLAVDSEMASKWPVATFPPRPVVPYSLSSTSKPTHPSTYNQKEIKWFIISSRLLHKVKTWKIKDRKGLSETLVQYILHSSLFPSFLSF